MIQPETMHFKSIQPDIDQHGKCRSFDIKSIQIFSDFNSQPIKLSYLSIYFKQKFPTPNPSALIPPTPFFNPPTSLLFMWSQVASRRVFLFYIQHLNWMNYPFIEGISGIQETEAMTGSRATNFNSPRSQHLLQNFSYDSSLSHGGNLPIDIESQSQPSYADLRNYVVKTLNSWGMKLNYLTENPENIDIINCFMELITQRFKDQENREHQKTELSTAVYERNKYQSLLDQQKAISSQKNRTIGRLENALNDQRAKMKQLEQTTKKERDQDKKMIAMLKSKNEQIVHEIKKKEQEANRVREQMKKNIGQKSSLKNVTFSVYEVFQKESFDQKADKIEALTSKYESQRKNLMKQNLLLRQKLYDIREEIVSFAEWIDSNIFRQSQPNYKNKFVINHSLLFKKESLVQELNQILESSKAGMKELIGMCQEARKSLQSATELKLEKSNSKAYEENLSPNNKLRSVAQIQKKPKESLAMQKKPSFAEGRISNKIQETPMVRRQKSFQRQMEIDDEDSEISIISHISTKQIVAENNKFDKWDLLLNHE